MATCSMDHYMSMSPIHPSIQYFIGQCEESDAEDPFEHFHFAICFKQQKRIVTIKKLFPVWNFKPITDIDGAITYVTKLENRIPDSLVEGGEKPVVRSSKKDWDKIKEKAKEGDFDSIDSSVFVGHYHNLKRIRSDYVTPPVRSDVEFIIYWGLTGSGKSFRAYTEATQNEETPYFKSSSNKWWDGYRGEKNVIVDEFEGKISVDHILRWVNWMPCLVETKGGTVPLQAVNFWFTSNINPLQWWKELPKSQEEAFSRRISLQVYFDTPYSE